MGDYGEHKEKFRNSQFCTLEPFSSCFFPFSDFLHVQDVRAGEKNVLHFGHLGALLGQVQHDLMQNITPSAPTMCLSSKLHQGAILPFPTPIV